MGETESDRESAQTGNAACGTAHSARHGQRPDKPGAMVVAAGGLVAGLVAFGVGEMIHELIPAKKVGIPTMGQIVIGPTGGDHECGGNAERGADFAVLGVCLGGFLGIAGGLARRSASAAVVAGLAGSILGLVLAAGASLVLIPFFLRTLPSHPEYDIILPMIMHASIWGLTGAAAGLAFALGLGEPRLLGRALAAGSVGAVLGTIAFELVGAAFFPLANTGQPISSTWPTRLMARLLVTVAAAAVVILSCPARSGARAPLRVRRRQA